MKVGIIGYKGFVGSAFYKVFSQGNEAVGIDRHNYQASKGGKFGLLINVNGNSSKRLADTEPEKDFEMNVASTLRFLHDFEFAHYLHISSVDVYNDLSSTGSSNEEAKIDSAKLSNYGLSKYIAELVTKKHAKSWMILRLGGMVGKNMAKGPAYDILKLGKLFISPSSKYQFINTFEVASIAKKLVEKGKWGQIYNIVGKGNISLEEFAKMAKVNLSETGKQEQVFNISTEKIEKECKISSTPETVKRFSESFRK